MHKFAASYCRPKILLMVFFTVATWASANVLTLPLAFFFDDPEDDREEALEDAATWSESELATINRPGFSLKYPKDWEIASHQADYDPDRLFSIETGGASHIMIEIFDANSGMNLESTMQSVLTALDGTAVNTYSYGDFETWGQYNGVGRHLKGKVMNIMPGGCRVFACVVPGKNKGILVTEFYMSDDLPNAMPGFELISQTLIFK
ncbi:hypothetical protein [Cerasicoccus maritimus]|uniref:hypothetical protein n=1 Tax=Cerasicoccus maritimus TaxID=490089 RepID=UPI002852CB02|nr:hypothetical protein [Cerasicoccus maritimus]